MEQQLTKFEQISDDAICRGTGKNKRGEQILRVDTIKVTDTHLTMKLYCSSESLLDYWFELAEEASHMLRFILAERCNLYTEHSIWPEDLESTELTTEGGWFVFTIRSRRRPPAAGGKA